MPLLLPQAAIPIKTVSARGVRVPSMAGKLETL